jgi:hypothetical protein
MLAAHHRRSLPPLSRGSEHGNGSVKKEKKKERESWEVKVKVVLAQVASMSSGLPGGLISPLPLEVEGAVRCRARVHSSCCRSGAYGCGVRPPLAAARSSTTTLLLRLWMVVDQLPIATH